MVSISRVGRPRRQYGNGETLLASHDQFDAPSIPVVPISAVCPIPRCVSATPSGSSALHATADCGLQLLDAGSVRPSAHDAKLGKSRETGERREVVIDDSGGAVQPDSFEFE